MDVKADVSLLGKPRLTAVKPHAYLDRPSHERLLRGGGRGNGIRGPGERHEERVPLSVDLDAVVGMKSLSQQPAVLLQRRRVLVAELVQELRRAFHVGEEARDDTHGKASIHQTIMANITRNVHGVKARHTIADGTNVEPRSTQTRSALRAHGARRSRAGPRARQGVPRGPGALRDRALSEAADVRNVIARIGFGSGSGGGGI